MQGRVWNYNMTRRAIMTMLCHYIILKYRILPSLKTKKCWKTMLETFILHRQNCAYSLYSKQVTYEFIQCFSHKLYIYLIFSIFSPFHGNPGFQAYLPAKHYFAIFFNMWMSTCIKICLKTIYIPSKIQKKHTNYFIYIQ